MNITCGDPRVYSGSRERGKDSAIFGNHGRRSVQRPSTATPSRYPHKTLSRSHSNLETWKRFRCVTVGLERREDAFETALMGLLSLKFHYFIGEKGETTHREA
ncbi:uncharacterized protein LOC142813907 [Rhipicephalus microplus]|uniref:uncharacterized protein LOC142813907 n=1 Tax=Rhipicephalus microplus TaxID=6941 RepID=UPI003F6ADF32